MKVFVLNQLYYVFSDLFTLEDKVFKTKKETEKFIKDFFAVNGVGLMYFANVTNQKELEE